MSPDPAKAYIEGRAYQIRQFMTILDVGLSRANGLTGEDRANAVAATVIALGLQLQRDTAAIMGGMATAIGDTTGPPAGSA